MIDRDGFMRQDRTAYVETQDSYPAEMKIVVGCD